MYLSRKSLLTLSVLVVLSGLGCSKSGDSSSSTTTTTPADTPVATASISGSVTGQTGGATNIARQKNHGLFGKFKGLLSSLGLVSISDVSDTCSSGTYTGAYVGGGGAVIVPETSFTDGSFTVPDVPQKKELILSFTCSDGSTQRCLVKSGDAGVYCDPVADAVMGAFEAALSTTITDAAFEGKSLAKVGASIVQAAQNDGTATAAFNTAIVACKNDATPSECYKNAIMASPFAGPFKLMQTMAQGWSVDALFTLMVDVYGAKIGVDSFIYSDFATSLDTWLSTDFVAETRTYISNAVADQLSGGNAYVTNLECQMWYSKYQSGGQISYPPVMETINGFEQPSCYNATALTANNIPSSARTAIHNAILAGTHGGSQIDASGSAVGCSGQGWNIPGFFCVSVPELVITSKFKEGNRNDPLGEHSGDFYNQPRVDMITVFDEMMAALQAAGSSDPASCLTQNNDGPPSVAATEQCQSWFGGIMASQKKAFAGLMGLYMYLKSPSTYGTGASNMLSLTQIHQLFAGSTFLNNFLTLTGFNTCGSQVTGGSGGSNYIPALAEYSNGIFTAQSGFGCSFSGNTMPIAQAMQKAALARIPYEADFQMFENIPSTSDIRNYVFGSGYHTDWNPTGPKLFWAAAIQNTGKPVLCKMTDATTGAPKESALDSNTAITCLTSAQFTAAGLSVPDENGRMTLPTGYPYTLQSYGYQGDGKGSVFALADAKTGFQIRTGSGPILIYQINAGNGAGSCDGSNGAGDGDVVTARLNFGWGSGTQQQAVPVYCMDMTNFAQSGTYMFYNGGQVEITQLNSDGTSWKWHAQQIGRRDTDNTNSQTLLPICYFADASSISVNSTTALVTTGGTVNGSGEITAVPGSDAVDLCENATSYSTKTQYYLIMSGMGWQSATRSSLKAHLIGTTSGAQILNWQNWSNSVTDWEDLQVFIRPATLETALNATSACSAGTANSCFVAPSSAQSPMINIQMANQKWDAKFDPYCDDRNGNGFCDCYEAGTTTLKDAGTCTLLDDAAEPTMSNPPYWANGANAADYEALFTQFGGKAGADLHWVNQNTNTVFNGQYLNTNQLWMDMSAVFQCQYLKSGETTYRSPTMLRWDDFGSLHHEGCPSSAGGSITAVSCSGSCTGGGPVRMVKPVAAKNTYAINRPNTLIKLINYATKTVGQGITIGATDQVFTFDEALALVALRWLMPQTDIVVHEPGTTTATSETAMPGVLPNFQQIWFGDESRNLDFASAVLRAITHPEELQ